MRTRLGEADDLPRLVEVELAADRLFADLGITFPPGTVMEEVTDPRRVLVAGRPAVAFAYAGPVDGHHHLHQLAVHPDHGRQGIGSALIDDVVERAEAAGAAVTLTTFRDVPWNGPWYARRGFLEWEPAGWGPELAAIVAAERQAGLEELGARIVMRRG